MGWELWLAIAAVAFASVALTLALVLWRRTHPRPAVGPLPATEHESERGQQVAVVINPSKEGADDVVERVKQVCADAALPAPLFYETTIEEPGGAQAKAALAAGASVVVAAGGDGTVRAVAGAMVGSTVPMAVLPVGTGNLLARNLDLPLTSVDDAMAVVVSGRDRRIDVGWARVTEIELGLDGEPRADAATPGDTQVFLVIAGLGFDAAMVADADDTLKRRVGWIAYFLAGVRHLHGRRLQVQVSLDGGEPVTTRLRSIMVGNCGRLPGGVTLLPDAEIDDGVLDVAAIDTRGGLAGWAQLLGEVVMQGAGLHNDLPGKIGRIDHARARRTRIRVAGGEHAQVDGDPMGRVLELEIWVDPGALLVRAG
ncbi:diacylglycerol kinase catalytic region [Xylanimonas cellulosilytica DSM 15894]|uniref:Diacylglycerol kinase catalytic region n=1 Tax=Xylanimonas cellulosilytica (strain DSM 15894 / JCM 12276 / CECT 5975 / KCTC 9989 / LMG 20990 / NBRC 107835 / XIL07) TaxID=446471 RepID=D1C0P0_XYLCX|nr:diacylglycerol kinase family protein [Xylanimonas cellulosilytica]ACZ32243.1 diacylglycerol kinase catalytic region [Xylanimonas cellulosilytica DSM 15894]